MKERFIVKRFRSASLEVIDKANEIAADYRQQGYNLTLRQLYYQFVARGLIPNSDRNYKNLGGIINDARLAGLLDWSYIEDRTRQVSGSFGGWDSPGDFIKAYAESYYEAVWEGQTYRPEVWVEKEALADVVARAARTYRVPWFACRGYVSQTAMYDAAKRFEQRREAGLTPLVIHLGDHDPSGIDMTRDIRDRLAEMSWGHVEVRRIALNMDQVEEFNPPPNPAKLTDSRGLTYVEEYGNESWELDALDPSVLNDLIVEEIETVLYRDMYERAVEQEDERTRRLVEIAERFDDLDANWSDIEHIINE